MKLLLFLLMVSITSCAQEPGSNNKADREVGGPCECCEGIYQQAPGFNTLSETDTLPDFESSPNKMLVYGVIYKNDGVIPAEDIILYIYHTDEKGYYTATAEQTGCAKMHRRLRGWIKTNNKGEYYFYTQKPAPYPNRNIPAHIHPVIKEQGLSDYYIDEYRFDDDPLLTAAERKNAENRGGNGIVKLIKDSSGMLLCKRDIILGENIPGY